MNNLFAQRGLSPMLIGATGDAFDSPAYLFELKFDGERCLAYLDPQNGTDLINKRGVRMSPKVPELAGIHKQVRKPCVLDGELLVFVDGKPDFYQIQRRSLTGNPFKIDLASKKFPATFAAFDLLYYDGELTTRPPPTERKRLLHSTVKAQNDRLLLSRHIEGMGKALYEMAQQEGLEGIVAKRADSRYFPGKRTQDWIKIKNLMDDDFIVCGYLMKENNMISLVLAQYGADNELVYKGHVTLGVGGDGFRRVRELPRLAAPPLEVPSGNQGAVWVEPALGGTVTLLDYTTSGGLRHPLLKGLRADKLPSECRTKEMQI
ncbi:MAG: DNA ligase [Clostridiales bacterium]|nr:DNA ligase [Clostridiales bacterium]